MGERHRLGDEKDAELVLPGSIQQFPFWKRYAFTELGSNFRFWAKRYFKNRRSRGIRKGRSQPRLDEDLAEAIALAHDLGHTPFGHAGQDELNGCMKDYGGFKHNPQSLRVVVDMLEERYAEFDGLNLTFETREGILKHCSPQNAVTFSEVGARLLPPQYQEKAQQDKPRAIPDYITGLTDHYAIRESRRLLAIEEG